MSNNDDIEQKAREAYEASCEEGTLQIPWVVLPEFAKAVWRDLAGGDAGAAVD